MSKDSHNDIRTARKFLAALYPAKLLRNERIEVRLKRDGRIKTHFCASTDQVIELAEKHKDKSDVYIALATRYGDTGGKKRDCYRVSCAWCDIDRSEEPDWGDLEPSVVVSSGHGFHCYWFLDAAYLVRGEGERWTKIEAINRALAKKYGADVNTVDITRVLRLPDTFNYKSKPPAVVRVLKAPGKLWKLNDFPSLPAPAPVDVGELSGGKERKLPAQLKAKLARVSVKPEDPSKQDFAVIAAMTEHIKLDKNLYATFAASKRGEDAAVRHAQFEDYMRRTIAAVRARTEPETVHIDFARRRDYKLEDGINSVTACNVEIERTHWLWRGYIPLGKITIIAGDPGMGKSTIALDIASRVSRGSLLPLSQKDRAPTGTCIIASAEDSPEDTITPRLIVAGANTKRIEVIREVKIEDQLCFLSLPRDLNRLRQMIVKYGARTLIIDPLNAFLEKGTDSHKDQDIRTVLAPVENMAEETGCAVVIVAHLNKKEDVLNTLYRIGGSVGFTGAARSVLAVVKNPNNGARTFYSEKNNVGSSPSPLIYRIQSAHRIRKSQDEWRGEPEVYSSKIVWEGRSIWNPKDASMSGDTEVQRFFDALFGAGEIMTAREAQDVGKQWGISRATIYRNKSNNGIETASKSVHGEYVWKRKEGWTRKR